ncbi:hypothetical protein NIES970_14150 [[Synechococcus] sp. NIES-970]|nr:hypothetical protein [Picosynechococcus sp. NKBG15041c]BAW96485.1 hypothetical protein NIES970_14150 [[Synechococcus] sp. NIES-970]
MDCNISTAKGRAIAQVTNASKMGVKFWLRGMMVEEKTNLWMQIF